MLSPAQTEFLTNVDPGSPMHEMLKRYWMPCALATDCAGPDSDPFRVTLLGEDYVLFRDSAGKLGLLRELCCHRGASLCLGRNEEGGLRCIYHGWKFDTEGQILDMPNCDDERFKARYRQPAFPVVEKAGVVWVYVGPKEKQPPFPHYPFFDVPEENIWVEAPAANANFVQMIEGLVDSSHLAFLHNDSLKNFQPERDNLGGTVFLDDLTPRLEAEDTDYGMRYAALREVPIEGGGVKTVARITAFALPFHTFIAAQPGSGTCVMSIPVSTGRTIFLHLFWSETQKLRGTEHEMLSRERLGLHDRGMEYFGLARDRRQLPESANRDNNWLQDREAMRRGETFTGLVNFLPEDIAVMESMGPVYQREYENLLNSDLGVARMRRTLVDSAERVMRGEDPVGVIQGEVPRGLQTEVTAEKPWKSFFQPGTPEREPEEA